MTATRIIFEPKIENGKHAYRTPKLKEWYHCDAGFCIKNCTYPPNEHFIYTRIAQEFEIPKWKPEVGEWYYYPDVTHSSLYGHTTFNEVGSDFRNIERGLACQTSVEAIELAKKMLEVIKKDQDQEKQSTLGLSVNLERDMPDPTDITSNFI